MEELDKALAEVTTGLVDLSRQVGPEAVEATLKAVQIGAWASIVGPLIFVLLGVLLLRFGLTEIKRGVELNKESDRYFNKPGENILMMGTALTTVSVFVIGLALFLLAIPGKWVAAFDPAAGLAWRILEKL